MKLYVDYDSVPAHLAENATRHEGPDGVLLVVFPDCPHIGEALDGDNGKTRIEYAFGGCSGQDARMLQWLDRQDIPFMIQGDGFELFAVVGDEANDQMSKRREFYGAVAAYHGGAANASVGGAG